MKNDNKRTRQHARHFESMSPSNLEKQRNDEEFEAKWKNNSQTSSCRKSPAMQLICAEIDHSSSQETWPSISLSQKNQLLSAEFVAVAETLKMSENCCLKQQSAREIWSVNESKAEREFSTQKQQQANCLTRPLLELQARLCVCGSCDQEEWEFEQRWMMTTKLSQTRPWEQQKIVAAKQTVVVAKRKRC